MSIKSSFLCLTFNLGRVPYCCHTDGCLIRKQAAIYMLTCTIPTLIALDLHSTGHWHAVSRVNMIICGFTIRNIETKMTED